MKKILIALMVSCILFSGCAKDGVLADTTGTPTHQVEFAYEDDDDADNFQIQFSSTGVFGTFHTIGTVKAIQGIKEYAYPYSAEAGTTVYWRIIGTSKNGVQTISDVQVYKHR